MSRCSRFSIIKTIMNGVSLIDLCHFRRAIVFCTPGFASLMWPTVKTVWDLYERVYRQRNPPHLKCQVPLQLNCVERKGSSLVDLSLLIFPDLFMFYL